MIVSTMIISISVKPRREVARDLRARSAGTLATSLEVAKRTELSSPGVSVPFVPGEQAKVARRFIAGFDRRKAGRAVGTLDRSLAALSNPPNGTAPAGKVLRGVTGKGAKQWDIFMGKWRANRNRRAEPA
jgi:hypothetical protein